jgi:hypothetical protein
MSGGTPTFGRKRRFLIATNVLAMSAAAIGLTIVVRRHVDLTEEQVFTLSDETEVLGGSREDDPRDRVIEACRADDDSVVMRAGSADDVRIEVLGLDDLADLDRRNLDSQPVKYRHMNVFRGEGVLTTTILAITEEKPPLIAFLQGHGEPDPEDQMVTPASMSALVMALVSDNFHVMALPLVTMNAVPDEVTILAIISPQRDLSQAEVSAVDAFVQRGGRLFLALDPTSTHTLDDLLRERFGLQRHYKVICEDKSQPGFIDSAKTTLVIGAYDPGSPVVASHRSRRLATFFRDACAIKGGSIPPKGVKLTPLLWTGNGAWEEESLSDEINDPVAEPKGPLTLAYQAQAGAELHDARLVLFGDSDWLRSELMQDAPGNKDLAISTCDWLAGRKEGR